MNEPMTPSMNCANFILPYPEEIANKTGSMGMVFSIRNLYLRIATDVEEKDPKWAAFMREVADHYPDVASGELVNRDSRGNVVLEEDDWDELTDGQKIHRGNVNAAIAVVDRIRYDLENLEYAYNASEDVTRIRRELGAISI